MSRASSVISRCVPSVHRTAGSHERRARGSGSARPAAGPPRSCAGIKIKRRKKASDVSREYLEQFSARSDVSYNLLRCISGASPPAPRGASLSTDGDQRPRPFRSSTTVQRPDTPHARLMVHSAGARLLKVDLPTVCEHNRDDGNPRVAHVAHWDGRAYYRSAAPRHECSRPLPRNTPHRSRVSRKLSEERRFQLIIRCLLYTDINFAMKASRWKIGFEPPCIRHSYAAAAWIDSCLTPFGTLRSKSCTRERMIKSGGMQFASSSYSFPRTLSSCVGIDAATPGRSTEVSGRQCTTQQTQGNQGT